MKLYNVEFDDIDHEDAHDYCDTFICYAEHEDGTPLSRDELESIDSDTTYELLMEHLY